jgi:hypothetical protein
MKFIGKEDIHNKIQILFSEHFKLEVLQPKIKPDVRDLYKIVFECRAPMRLEITDSLHEYMHCQNVCSSRNVNVSKELFVYHVDGLYFRFVEFIEGQILAEQWFDITKFFELGVLVRSIHDIVIDGKIITNYDMSKRNCVISNEDKKLYLIDTDSMIFGKEEDVIKTFAYICEKCLRNDRDRVRAFCEGYEKDKREELLNYWRV